jgi:NRPS condensation-like uncharacterized protein
MKYKAETFDVWQSLPGPTAYEPLMFSKVEYEGRIDLDILIQAITLSIRTIPHIACTFDCAESRPCWVKKDFTGKDMVRAVEEEDDVEKQITDFLVESIDPAKGPQVKLLLIRRSDGDTLCVLTTHRVCDAGGFRQYLSLLSELYTALISDKPVPDYPLYTRGSEPLFAGMTLRDKIRLLRSRHEDPFTSTEQAGKGRFVFDKENAKAHREIQKIPEESFIRLKSFAKAHNATVNDIFLALSGRAYCACTNTEKLSFPCTMDLRKFIPAGVKYGITNYSGLCMCSVSFKPGDLFTDTLQQVCEQMRYYKTGNSVLKPTLSLRLMLRFVPRTFIKKVFLKSISLPIFTFTNAGLLDRSFFRLGDLVIRDAYSAPAFSLAPQLLFNLSTFDNHCTLDFSFYGSDNDVKMARALLNYMAAEIETLA